MVFEDYAETGCLYHVVHIMDLERTLSCGLKYDCKATYKGKYIDFHSYLDDNRTKQIPAWVERKKAIFASMNFKDGHTWHSHSALLKIKIQEEKCWVCNENFANNLYEPLVLQKTPFFKCAAQFIESNGREWARTYWECSSSFSDNLKIRNDKNEGYDAEVLVLHDIPPENIELIYIISDHKCMSVNQWREYFRRNILK